MPELKEFPLHGNHGIRGSILAKARFLDDDTDRLVRFNDGREFLVRPDQLELAPDGSFRLLASPEQLQPVAHPGDEPPPRVSVSAPQAGVAVETDAVTALNADLLVAPLYRSGYDVQRIEVNQIVEEEPRMREEGDTLILPVFEEVLIVQKRWLLREEVRVLRRREQLRESERQILRREAGIAPE